MNKTQKVLNPVWQKRIELEAEVLSYRNTLATVAQMRKAQQALFYAVSPANKEKLMIEAKKLETAVDMRLSQHEIKAVG